MTLIYTNKRITRIGLKGLKLLCVKFMRKIKIGKKDQ